MCEYLHSTFIISPDEDCGLHIHVGQGNNWLPFKPLRKIAAFLYAADPVLAQCHPMHRRKNLFCPSPRLYSMVSLGVKRSHFFDDDDTMSPPDQNITLVSGIEQKNEGSSILCFRSSEEDQEIGTRKPEEGMSFLVDLILQPVS